MRTLTGSSVARSVYLLGDSTMEWFRKISDRLSTRSVVVLGLLAGATTLAILDADFRPAYADLAKIGLGGYLAQLVPGKGN